MMKEDIVGDISSGWRSFIRKSVFRVLRLGPIPSHIAVIMDGNRRYAKKKKLPEGAAYDAGAMALLHLLVYCYELGVTYVTAYAFGIDNFRRNPEQVKKIMDLMLESVVILTRISNHHPVRVHFAGNLELLRADLRDALRRIMEVTADHTKLVVTLCVSYNSSDEIIHAVQESCREKFDPSQKIKGIDDSHQDETKFVKLADIEKHMYMAIAADPDMLIRTSGEHRLSNFLLWQTCYTLLSCFTTVWPEFGSWHLVLAVLDFQQHYPYFAKKKIAAVDLANGSKDMFISS